MQQMGGIYLPKKTTLLPALILFVFAFSVEAQSNGADPETRPAEQTEIKPETPAPSGEQSAAQKEKADRERIIELDIKTATLMELAEWSSELGLGEGGGREEIAGRIRRHYNMGNPETKKWDRVITIESARTTEYFKIDSVNEEYARLSGGVVISLKDGEALHRIEAWDILFNRTRNVVSASGGVSYKREEGSTIETFTGDSIIINLDTWVGSFIDTVSERAMSGGETAYRFAGQVISKTDSETTVLKNAVISNAKSEEPYWSLNASRIWLFPGSDWAFANAVLKVGEIPVLYIPFFAYPADEIIFHPVMGTRTRHGFYLQTTTYLLGQPKADPSKANSISKILGSGDGMQKERHGLFLRSSGKAETRNNDRSLSLLFDAYTNLGFYTGVDLNFTKALIFNNLKFYLGLGWTRTLYNYDGFWTPYILENDKWESKWDHSWLFGNEVPFRYIFNLETGTSGRLGSLDVKFPLYSDPFMHRDLVQNRSEQIDIMNLLTSGSFEDITSTETTTGSYQWNVNIRPNISTNFFAPWISSISINTISTSLGFIPSRDVPSSNPRENSPTRQFFIPDKYTIYTMSASLSGSPFSPAAKTAQAEIEQKNPFEGIGDPVSPWAEEDKKAAAKSALPSANIDELKPPVLSQLWTLPSNNLLQFSMNYSLSPSSATEAQYYTKDFLGGNNKTAKDIDWDDFESVLSNFRTDASTNFSISEANNNLFNATLGFSGSYQWQDHTYFRDDLPEADKKTMRLTDYRGRQWTINSSYNFTLNPFYWNPVWKSTNFQYNLSGLVARSLFNEQKYNEDVVNSGNPLYQPDPEWKLENMKWTRDYISSHKLSANVGMNLMDKMQNLVLSMDLPPRYQLYSGNLTMRAWRFESNANMQIQEDTEENKAAAKNSNELKYRYVSGYLFKPLYLTQTLNFASRKSARLYTVWDPELDEWTNFSLNGAWNSFSVTYNAAYMYKYFYDPTPGKQGWKQESATDGATQKLYPRDFTMSWAPSFKLPAFFHGLINLSINTNSSISLDLQRYTYSRFNFSLGLTLGITKFLDFTISTNSENAEIYRYIQDFAIFDSLDIEVGQGKEKNFFIDLLNSFRFDNEELRKQSGYKLKSFSFSAVHHLGDWDATLKVSLNPYLDNSAGNPSDWQYKFRTTFSFFVQWLPITEIQAGVDYENEKFIKRERTSN
ncbi:MAG: LPS-assembly protein LptD [Termitinemataceae bacterium]|nr:MAG: LPS-assembly protein LptD [Termitinemataceae bacterium]